MEFYGYHGVFKEETKLGQRFIVDAVLELDLRQAGESDDMTQSIHYGRAYEVIRDIVEGRAKNLVEAVAEEIAKQLFAAFSLLEACTVKVIKPDPPIAGHYESVAVEIRRERP